MGYPRLAAYLASSTESLQFRGFSYLRVRLLLEQQDELRRLENELEEVDNHDGSGPSEQKRYLCNRRADRRARKHKEPNRSRTEIFADIYEKMRRYRIPYFLINALRQNRILIQYQMKH